MSTTPAADLNRLYALLPRHHRREDVAQGEPLRALLRLVAEQVNVVEEDIAQLYDNWFVETAEDWGVPYLAELIGYRPVHELGAALDPDEPGAAALARVLVPRREVANTVAYRRRKGTLTLLELLSRDIAGWHARAVAYGPLTAMTQHLESLWPLRGRTVDLRDGKALERIGGPFDPHAHTPDVRRVGSPRRQGLHNLPHVAVFVWRLQSFLVDRTPGYCVEAAGSHCYTFSILGNDVPLYQPGTSPATLGDPPRAVQPVDLRLAITRRAFELHDEPHANPDHYGRTPPSPCGRRTGPTAALSSRSRSSASCPPTSRTGTTTPPPAGSPSTPNSGVSPSPAVSSRDGAYGSATTTRPSPSWEAAPTAACCRPPTAR